jgi:hypothetical protein
MDEAQNDGSVARRAPACAASSERWGRGRTRDSCSFAEVVCRARRRRLHPARASEVQRVIVIANANGRLAIRSRAPRRCGASSKRL